MIKFERKDTQKAQCAIEALQNAKMRKSSYNTKEVNEALIEMFYGKCYICENKEATSYQIEHLTSHHENIDLKYDWNNLLWSCAHCNNTKLDKYEPILDCTKKDVDELIAFRKTGYFGTDEQLQFEALSTEEEVLNTIQLLQDVYYGTTPQKKIEAKVIRKKLRKELHDFKDSVREYQEAEGEEKEDLLFLIKKELKSSSAFTAFKRWLIRDNGEYYPELAVLLKNN